MIAIFFKIICLFIIVYFLPHGFPWGIFHSKPLFYSYPISYPPLMRKSVRTSGNSLKTDSTDIYVIGAMNISHFLLFISNILLSHFVQIIKKNSLHLFLKKLFGNISLYVMYGEIFFYQDIY